MIKRLLPNKRSNEEFNTYLEVNYHVNPVKEAFIITGIYGVFGLIWIVLSDWVLFYLVNDIAVYSQFQTYKGWLYVVVTMILIYSLVRTRSRLFQKALSKTREAYQDLEATYEELVATGEELVATGVELTHQKEFTENMIKDAPVIIATWDSEGKIRTLNPYGCTLLGYSEEEIIGRTWDDLVSGHDSDAYVEEIIEKIKKDHVVNNIESRLMTKKNKELIILWNSSILRTSAYSSEVVSIGTDITSRKMIEEKLKDMAYYDTLTKLPNRDLLEIETLKCIQEQRPFAIAYMDLDNFKLVNDTLGHIVGDECLKFVSEKMRQVIQPPNVLARVSGDEYAILFAKCSEQDEIREELTKALQNIGRTWKKNHHEFLISLSIGVAVYPENGHDPTTLFKNADIAMYKAKKAGKSRCVFYTEDILVDSQKNVQLVNRLQSALEKNELQMHYQPQVDLESGDIIGAEALIRWYDHIEGFIAPAVFIPLAEDTGQIYAIEKWVVQAVLTQKKKFEEDGHRGISLSLNISSKTLTSDMNFYEIENLLASVDVNYSQITIEITETAILSNLDLVIERLHRLKKLGVKIALDDFGTGYSSLTYLKNLPIDIVKLDRSFVKSIEEDDKDAKIIKSLLLLAEDLGYRVVAEGIETPQQLAFLQKYKCTIGQGFLFSKAVPIEIMIQKLSQSSKQEELC